MKVRMTLASIASIFFMSGALAYSDTRGQQFFDEEYVENNLVRISEDGRYSERIRTEFPKRINPPGVRVFVFSPRYRGWAAYLPDGTRVGYGKANGGSHWCSEIGRPCRTPVGTFQVLSKGSPGCVSNKYPLPSGGAPMPYCMRFHGGYAIHGSPGISNNNSSHGCIRVHTPAARWLSNNFMRIGTRVKIMGY